MIAEMEGSMPIETIVHESSSYVLNADRLPTLLSTIRAHVGCHLLNIRNPRDQCKAGLSGWFTCVCMMRWRGPWVRQQFEHYLCLNTHYRVSNGKPSHRLPSWQVAHSGTAGQPHNDWSGIISYIGRLFIPTGMPNVRTRYSMRCCASALRMNGISCICVA